MVHFANEAVELAMLEEDCSLQLVGRILEDHGAFNVECSVSKQHPSQFVGWVLKRDFLSILELNVVGSLVPHDQRVLADLRIELIEPPEVVQVIWVLNVEVRNGRMVTSVLAVDLSTIAVLSLEGFSQQRIERLLLFDSAVQTSESEGDHVFEPLLFVLGLSCLLQIDWSKAIPVADPFQQTPRFKDPHRQGDPNHALAREDVRSCLLDHVFDYSLLLVQDLLVDALQTVLVLHFQVKQDLSLGFGLLDVQRVVGEVGGRRSCGDEVVL